MPENFHDKAKETGNTLKSYILSFSSVATGVFFFRLTGEHVAQFSYLEKTLLILAMSFFAVTVLLCLIELHIDAKRFFLSAKEVKKPEQERDWAAIKRLKSFRVKLMFSSYGTIFIGFAFAFVYMVQRIA